MSGDTQIRSIFERWERLEGEKRAISDDLKELFSEAKHAGYDSKALRAAFNRKVKQDAETTADQQFDMVVDTYLDAINGVARDVRMRTRENIEEFDPITGEFINDNSNPVANVEEGATSTTAAASNDPASRTDDESERQHSSTVGFADDCCTGGKEQSAAAAAPVGDAGAYAEGIPALNSQIDPPEDRSEGHSLDAGSADANAGGDHVTAQENAAKEQAGSLVHPDPAITFEAVPHTGMKSLPYAHCFPELSKTERQCLEGDIAINGVLEPIVRMGDVIVDGWNRYNAARSLGIEYPVKSYSGDDVLLDVIRWQRSSRDWTPQQEHKIATDLAKAIPHRSKDIWAAFHLAPTSGEVVAA